MCAFALGVLEGGRACRLSPVTSVAGCSMDAGSCTCRFRGVSCCTSGERARGYQANPGEGLERVSRRGRRLAGLVAAAATATGAGGRGAGRANGGRTLTTCFLCVFQASGGRVPCLSTLSIYKNAAIPARLATSTAAAPVAWIPWR